MARGLVVKEKSVGSLLRDSTRIVVPIYQRAYSWKDEQIDELLEDLQTIIDLPPHERAHFLGTVVFSSEDSRTPDPDLVDGQQRLSTICLILAALNHKLEPVPIQRAGATRHIIQQMLFNPPHGTLEEWEKNDEGRSIKFRPGAKDRENFGHLLVNGNPADGRLRMSLAWKHIVEEIDRLARQRIPSDLEADSRDWEAAKHAALDTLAHDMVSVIDSALSLGVIDVGEPHNPFAVFESLNSKGLDLAESDLIKNYLLKNLDSKSDRETAVKRWNSFCEIVPKDRLVDFLRHWYVATKVRIPKSVVYKRYKTQLHNRDAIFQTIESLTYHAYWYRTFVTGQFHEDHPSLVGISIPHEVSRRFDRFARLNFKQGLPILMALVESENFDTRQREGLASLGETIKIIETMFVRLFVTRNVRGSVVEAELNNLCSSARKEGMASPDKLWRIVHRICEENKAAGLLDWSDLQPTIARARFLLYRIAEHQLGKGIHLSDPDLWHVEHIIPQTRPPGEFRDLDEEEYGKLVSHIGNMTLLLNHDNQSLRNKHPAEKLAIYAKYDGTEDPEETATRDEPPRPLFPMNRDLPSEYPTWDSVTIDRRAQRLGDVASQVWQFPSAVLSPRQEVLNN